MRSGSQGRSARLLYLEQHADPPVETEAMKSQNGCDGCSYPVDALLCVHFCLVLLQYTYTCLDIFAIATALALLPPMSSALMYQSSQNNSKCKLPAESWRYI